MPLSLEAQFNIVLYSILSGILAGILFDLYNIIRGSKIPKIILFIEDILLCLLRSLCIHFYDLDLNYLLKAYKP